MFPDQDSRPSRFVGTCFIILENLTRFESTSKDRVAAAASHRHDTFCPTKMVGRNRRCFTNQFLSLEVFRGFPEMLRNHDVRVSINVGTPKWMVYFENPIEMDDIG